MSLVYSGKTAAEYDKKRRRKKRWKSEIEIIQKIVAEFDPESLILDVPLGTGRFLPIYKKKHQRVMGLDISMDMLRLAKGKSTGGETAPMVIGQAQRLPLSSQSVDYAVCIRLVNWLTTSVAKEVIRELHRVVRKGVVVGFRTQRRISFKEFILHFLVDIVPTPLHMRRWKRLLHTFWKRVKGKIKHTASKFGIGANAFLDSGEGNQSRFHDKRELMAFCADLKMEIREVFYIDSLASYSSGKLRPYSIYWLKVND